MVPANLNRKFLFTDIILGVLLGFAVHLNSTNLKPDIHDIERYLYHGRSTMSHTAPRDAYRISLYFQTFSAGLSLCYLLGLIDKKWFNLQSYIKILLVMFQIILISSLKEAQWKGIILLGIPWNGWMGIRVYAWSKNTPSESKTLL